MINGTFSGVVDLSFAVLHHVPLGSIAGTFTITRTADLTTGMLGNLPEPIVLPFNGTFRMPFKLGAQGRFERSERDHAALYLGDDLHTVIPVKAFERSTGFPDVRLEVSYFGTACLNSSSRFPSNSGASVDSPVTLPPGFARLDTSPAATGSTTRSHRARCRSGSPEA